MHPPETSSIHRLLASGAALLSLVSAGPARAEIGALDPVPAATLLLPYFEVDLGSPTGVTTVFSVGNAGEGPAIVHVELWTDLSVPTLGFDMYLTGYDLITVDLRPLFTSGALPQTSHNNTGISPVGLFSLTTNPETGVGPGSTSCSSELPLPPLSAAMLIHIRRLHIGQDSPVLGGLCGGWDHGDNVARGYITFNSVSSCSLQFPHDSGYFVSGGSGVANNQNVLLGDYAVVNPGAGTAFGDPMVHLEADPTLGPGHYTFWRRYSNGADNREPLGTSFWVRYAGGGVFTGGTEIVFWRDSKRTINPFNCALTAPAPFPLGQTQVVVFDEQENAELPAGAFFPQESGRAEVQGAGVPATADFGWMYLNLNHAVAGSQVPFEPAMQNLVAVRQTAAGAFSLGFDAFQLDSVLAASNVSLPACDTVPPPPGCPQVVLFADGFESGSLAAWDLVFP